MTHGLVGKRAHAFRISVQAEYRRGVQDLSSQSGTSERVCLCSVFEGVCVALRGRGKVGMGVTIFRTIILFKGNKVLVLNSIWEVFFPYFFFFPL